MKSPALSPAGLCRSVRFYRHTSTMMVSLSSPARTLWRKIPFLFWSFLVKAKTSNWPKQATFSRSQRGFTRKMTWPPTQIRHEIIISRNRPCHTVQITFWDVPPGLLIDSIRPCKKMLGPFLIQMGPKVAHIEKIAHNFLNVNLMQSNVGSLMKILKSC